nr:copia protein [Tanacetum cinerariifolium]
MDFASNKPLYLLYMDLCGSMCVKSINGKRYVLVVVDDYSRYMWVFFLLSKDKASEVIISFIKKTQVNLQLQVHRVRTDNSTEFKNKNLANFIDELKAKWDIGVFVGYSKESAAFRVYNKRTRNIHESVNVNFDEISEMASKQFSLEPGEVFHEVSESFQEESSSSSLNDDVQQISEEVMVLSTNTQSVLNKSVSNVHEASTSHNVFNKRLEDAYFDASTMFHDPSKEVYVGQPPGFVSKQYPDHVYALDKALYGLKQAPRAWYDILSKFLIDSGFQKAESEYVVVSGCCAQVLWMCSQLTDYNFFYDKVPIYCDTKSAIAISCNPIFIMVFTDILSKGIILAYVD